MCVHACLHTTPHARFVVAEAFVLRLGRTANAAVRHERNIASARRLAADDETEEHDVITGLDFALGPTLGIRQAPLVEDGHGVPGFTPDDIGEFVVRLRGEEGAERVMVRAEEIDDELPACAKGRERPARPVDADEQERRLGGDARDRLGRETAWPAQQVECGDDGYARRKAAHDREELVPADPLLPFLEKRNDDLPPGFLHVLAEPVRRVKRMDAAELLEVDGHRLGDDDAHSCLVAIGDRPHKRRRSWTRCSFPPSERGTLPGGTTLTATVHPVVSFTSRASSRSWPVPSTSTVSSSSVPDRVTTRR